MARGYTEDPEDPGYRPSRPTRRAESQRGYDDLKARGYDDLKARGFTAHYAESPVIQSDQPQPRTLPRRSARSRNSTLPRSEAARSASRASRASRPGNNNNAVSKVTRSRSWGARPAGVVVYNRHGEPVETNTQGPQPPSKPPSTIGVGYRPNTALRCCPAVTLHC